MELNIKPLADRVIVKAAQAEQKTAGGIIIPDSAKEKPCRPNRRHRRKLDRQTQQR